MAPHKYRYLLVILVSKIVILRRKSAITREKLKAIYKHTSLCSSATHFQQFGISCMELSRVLQYISTFTVLHRLIWPYVFFYAFMRSVKVVMIRDASSEVEGVKILQSFILQFYRIQSNEARSVRI